MENSSQAMVHQNQYIIINKAYIASKPQTCKNYRYQYDQFTDTIQILHDGYLNDCEYCQKNGCFHLSYTGHEEFPLHYLDYFCNNSKKWFKYEHSNIFCTICKYFNDCAEINYRIRTFSDSHEGFEPLYLRATTSPIPYELPDYTDTKGSECTDECKTSDHQTFKPIDNLTNY